MSDEQRGHDWLLEVTQPSQFDFDEIDRSLVDDAPDHPDSVELRRLFRESERSSEIATALLIALEMCLPRSKTQISISQKTARVAGAKLLTLLWMLRSERLDLARIGQTQVAQGLGCTRALISHYARYWNKATGLRCRMQKMEGASQSYRAASERGWATRRSKELGDDLMPEDEEMPEESRHRIYEDEDEDYSNTDDLIPSWERGR